MMYSDRSKYYIAAWRRRLNLISFELRLSLDYLPNRFCETVWIELSVHCATNHFMRLIVVSKLIQYCCFDNRLLPSVRYDITAVIREHLKEGIKRWEVNVRQKLVRILFFSQSAHRDVFEEEQKFLHAGVAPEYVGLWGWGNTSSP